MDNPESQPEDGEKQQIEELVVRSVEGDSDAFGQLYVLFAEKIYRYIYYHNKDVSSSQDLTGEVFLKAWQAIGSCRGKENTFSAWLYRIAHNQLVDDIRKKQRRPAVELDNEDNISDSRSSAEQYSEQQELLTVIDLLPPNQKQIIILKFIEGMDNSEIAKITGKREGAIRALQMRALANLKKELSKE